MITVIIMMMMRVKSVISRVGCLPSPAPLPASCNLFPCVPQPKGILVLANPNPLENGCTAGLQLTKVQCFILQWYTCYVYLNHS